MSATATAAEPAIEEALLTAEDLLRQPQGEERTELVEGRMIRMAPAGAEHGELAMTLSGPLWQHVREKDLGRVYASETGFILAREPDTVRSPDVAFVAKERLPKERQTGFFDGAPDLAVEVISPSETATEVEAKVRDYLAAGTQLVWLVYPDEKMVRVHRPDGTTELVQADGRLSGEKLLPGFELALDELWGEKD